MNKTIDQWCFILIQVLVPVAFGLLAITLGQDTSWDVQNYHLYNAYSFLHDRLNFDLFPAGWVNCLNPYLDLVYFEVARHATPWMAGFILGFVQGLNFSLLLHIGKYCLRSIKLEYARWSMILAFLGVLTIGFLSEVGCVYWDNVVSLFPLTSLLIIIASMSSVVSGQRCVLFLVALAGIIAGVGSGLKLIVAPYAVALLFSFFFIPIPWKKKLMLAALFGGAVAVGLMVSDGAWLCYIWHQMGNPIFPYMNNIFHGALAPFASIHDSRYLPKDLFEGIFYPIVFTINPFRIGDHHCIAQISWLIVYLASIFFFFSRGVYFLGQKKTDPLSPEVKYLLSFFWFSYLLWLIIYSVYRYQITIEMLIPLVLFVLFLSMVKADRLMQMVVVVMLAFVTFYNIKGVPDWGHSNWAPKVYQIKTPWSQNQRVDCVILISEPLSWIIPALDMKVPFIQIMPNAIDQFRMPNYFPVNEAYFQRAKSMLKYARDGKILVIFQSVWISVQNADDQLRTYGLVLKREGCSEETGYLGTRRIPFMFCPAERIFNR